MLTGAVSAISVAGNSVSWTTSGSYTADTVSISANQTAGARFTLISPVLITQIYIPAVHFTVGGTTPRDFRFYREGTSYPIASYTVPKTTLVGQNYIFNLSSPLSLVSGTYRYGVGIPPFQTGFSSTATFTFDSRIVSVNGCFSLAGQTQYPDGNGTIANLPRSGGFLISPITDGTLSVGSSLLTSTTSSLLKTTLGGVSYGLAGPLHSAGGRANPATQQVIYDDGAGFRLAWMTTAQQLAYDIATLWYGSNSVVRSILVQKTDVLSTNGVSTNIVGSAYFSSGTATATAGYDLSVGRTIRMTLCSADSSQAGSPLIEITAMRTNTCIIWRVNRNAWDNALF